MQVPKGQNVVEAAAQHGVEIPVFCYEPRLGPPVGACRMCLCEVEGNCLCVLGDACAMPVRSHIRNFREEFEEHARLGRCPCPDDAPMSELYPPLLRAPLPMVAAT